MDKFRIKPRKNYGESTVVSARLPNDLIKELESVVAKTGRSRNELIMMCVEYALKNLEIETDEK